MDNIYIYIYTSMYYIYILSLCIYIYTHMWFDSDCLKGILMVSWYNDNLSFWGMEHVDHIP